MVPNGRSKTVYMQPSHSASELCPAVMVRHISFCKNVFHLHISMDRSNTLWLTLMPSALQRPHLSPQVILEEGWAIPIDVALM